MDKVGAKQTKIEWENDDSDSAISVRDHNSNGGSTGWEVWLGRKRGSTRQYNRTVDLGGQEVFPNKKKAMKVARKYMERHPQG